VARLAETLSPDQPPIIIVNGRRIVNASDFLRFPPDALARVEVLPPEAASLFGGEPARRVVNIVMQPRFKSRDAQLSATLPTGGGTSSVRGDLRQSEIQDDNSLQFGTQAARTTPLYYPASVTPPPPRLVWSPSPSLRAREETGRRGVGPLHRRSGGPFVRSCPTTVPPPQGGGFGHDAPLTIRDSIVGFIAKTRAISTT